MSINLYGDGELAGALVALSAAPEALPHIDLHRREIDWGAIEADVSYSTGRMLVDVAKSLWSGTGEVDFGRLVNHANGPQMRAVMGAVAVARGEQLTRDPDGGNWEILAKAVAALPRRVDMCPAEWWACQSCGLAQDAARPDGSRGCAGCGTPVNPLHGDVVGPCRAAQAWAVRGSSGTELLLCEGHKRNAVDGGGLLGATATPLVG